MYERDHPELHQLKQEGIETIQQVQSLLEANRLSEARKLAITIKIEALRTHALLRCERSIPVVASH